MGINTSRLLMVVIIMNLVISVAYGIYEQPNTFDKTIAGNYVDTGEDYGTSLGNENTGINPESYQQEGSFGNAVRMGAKIFGLFIKGLNPFPFNTADIENEFDLILVIGLALFRVFMYMIIGIKIYQVFKNKDTQ